MLLRGMYRYQLDFWKEYFPLHESIHIINHEFFEAYPELVYQDLFAFMGLDVFLPEAKRNHVGQEHRLAIETRQYLSALFRPHNKNLVELLGSMWEEVWPDEN